MAKPTDYELTEIEKLCFSCPPEFADRCGERGLKCAFMLATKDNLPARARTPTIQHTCGVIEKFDND